MSSLDKTEISVVVGVAVAVFGLEFGVLGLANRGTEMTMPMMLKKKKMMMRMRMSRMNLIWWEWQCCTDESVDGNVKLVVLVRWIGDNQPPRKKEGRVP